MSLKHGYNPFRTLTFRLTLWYAVLFTVSSLAVLATVSLVLSSSLRRRRDTDLRDDARELESLFREKGSSALQPRFVEEGQSNGVNKVFLLLLSPRREILASSDLSAWKGMDYTAWRRGGGFRTVSVRGHSHKVRVLITPMGQGLTLVHGDSRETDEKLMANVRATFEMVSAGMLLLGSVLGWWIARRAMSGVRRITRTATRIAKGDLTRRVPVRGEGEEVDHLAMAFNAMLEQIDSLVYELRELSNNIAHDLRSPITSIRGIAETTLTGPPGLEEYRTMAGMIVEECDRLVTMINTTLEIAATDSGAAHVAKSPVDVLEIVRKAHDLFQPVAEDKGVTMEIPATAGPMTTLGTLDGLQRVVANLLDNAIKYTPAGGRVILTAGTTTEHLQISVIDSGIGIPAEDLPRVFTRFYRGDRSRSAAGNGLGLSLAKAIVRAHGGDIEATSSPGQGSTFTVLLPRHFPAVRTYITKK